MVGSARTAREKMPLSHNLVGQRLGRKGRGTRERILAATERLLGDPEATISLSAVAREAALGMTTLYLYFSDLTELLLALLEPVVASAEESHMAHTRKHWASENLRQNCQEFVSSYYAYWKRNAGILHLRNSLADSGNERMGVHRIASSQPLIELIIHQMGCEEAEITSPTGAMAVVLITGIERVTTLITRPSFSPAGLPESYLRNLLAAQARLLELAIRDHREVG